MKKHIAARRKRNLELGKRDLAARCSVCKRELPAPGYRYHSLTEMFCSSDCLQTSLERKDIEAKR